MEVVEQEFKSMYEFWPFYVGEHQNPNNRKLHFVGSSLGLFFLSKAIIKRKPSYILLGLVIGYGCAWAGHFLVEKNKPATFKHPLKSFLSDWVMFSLMLRGKMDEEIKRIELLNEDSL